MIHVVASKSEMMTKIRLFFSHEECPASYCVKAVIVLFIFWLHSSLKIGYGYNFIFRLECK